MNLSISMYSYMTIFFGRVTDNKRVCVFERMRFFERSFPISRMQRGKYSLFETGYIDSFRTRLLYMYMSTLVL